MKKINLLFLLLICLMTTGQAQKLDTKKLDAYFDKLQEKDKFMGSVAIIKEGKVIYTNQIGYSTVSNHQKPNKNTKYRIGSISKTFTAVLTLKAMEEQRLKLETKIEHYFPSIEHGDKITIKDLLYHSSGIFNFTNDPAYMSYYTEAKSEEEMIAIINKKGSVFTPGSKTEYSNSNYVLLSYILQKVYKHSYADILENELVKPLKLKNTYFGSAIDVQNNECYSYQYTDKWEKMEATNTLIPMGAGGIVSTPTDLLTFADALFNHKIITKGSLGLMTTLKGHFGMGIFEMPIYEKKSYGHNGAIDGFSSVFGYFPDEQYGYAFISNGANYETSHISNAMLSMMFDKPFEIPTFEQYQITEKELEQYLGVYSAQNFPLKISITKTGNTLVAQATGQSSFPLEPTSSNTFVFHKAGIELEFDAEKQQMTLKQGGGAHLLSKE